MHMLISVCTLTSEDKIRELIVSGIPSVKEDIEDTPEYQEFVKDIHDKKFVDVNVKTYFYSENEEGLRDYDSLLARIKRDFRFIGEHCEFCRESKFVFWVNG